LLLLLLDLLPQHAQQHLCLRACHSTAQHSMAAVHVVRVEVREVDNKPSWQQWVCLCCCLLLSPSCRGPRAHIADRVMYCPRGHTICVSGHTCCCGCPQGPRLCCCLCRLCVLHPRMRCRQPLLQLADLLLRQRVCLLLLL
jgi:hypothetical protein